VNRRLPGLDGLRGIAVLAVIIYHADVSLLVGGFLGVDVFFVLSGFLITSLLLDELIQTNTVDRARFYMRRIRRLMPALFLVLFFSVLVSGLFVLDAAYHVRRDLPWAITFVLNWSYLFFEQSYFVNISRPPLLQHLWSLSVEEQFYVIWPILLVALYKVKIGNLAPRVKIFFVPAALAIASTAWMIHLSVTNGFPIPNDPSRVYFGTDTHAMGLLVGCAAAALWRHEKLNARLTPDRAAALNVIGLVSLAGLAYFFVFVSELNEFLYRGGFLVLSLLTASLVLVAAHPGLKFGAILGNPVLKWFGDRSYGIYLWHWPIFVLMRSGIDIQWAEPIAFTAKIAIVLVVADLSYRFVEMPIRNGAIGTRLAIWRAAGVPRPQARTLLASTLTIAVLTASLVGMYRVPTPDAGNLTGIGGITAIDDDPADQIVVVPTPNADPLISAQQAVQVRKDIQNKLAPVVFGDSVVLSARDSLRSIIGKVSIDAAVSRQPKVIADRIRARRDEQRLGANVVIHMGTNGIVQESDLKPILEQLRDRNRVVVVNVQVPRVWMKPTNKMISTLVKQYPNVRLADWNSVSKGKKKYFAPDGVHLTKTGADVFGNLVNDTLRGP
jgi:peptidoglycan/LPS O-acetylase OafA/YrhL